MKSRSQLIQSWPGLLILLTMSVGITVPAEAQNRSRYTVTDLGALGGTYSYAYGINNAGVVSGGAATPSQTDGLSQTAVLWYPAHQSWHAGRS